MVDRLTDAMNDRARQTNHEGLNEEIVNLLRLAALLHDVGHGTMSHVSENAMAYFEELDSLKKDFADEHSVETKIQLSEIAAFYLLRSPAFHELLQAAQETTNDHVLPQDAVQLISGIIVGQQIDPRIPLLQELISGPFDADKLDYITRDATMAGVPIVTDVPRLVQKVRLQTLTEAELPKDIGEKIRGGFRTYLFTGVAISGNRTLDELMLGRTLLHDKIYRHQKVRVAEAMVASALIELAALLNVPPWQLVYQLSDEQLLNMSVEELRWRQGGSWAPDQDDRATLIVDLLARLRNRELLVRSYAFAQNMALDPYRADSAQRVGLMQVLGLDPTELRELAREIANEILNMRSLLKEGPFNSIAPESLSAYIWVDPPDSTNRRGGTPRAFLIPESGAPIRFRDESGETKGWANAYRSTRDIGFVFAPVEASSYAYLATEKLLRTRFGIRSPNSMLELAKHNAKELDALRRRLALAGFYDDLPLDLRPMPPDLLSVAGRRLVAETCQGLAQFEGIYREGFPHQTVEVSEERIIDWIRQLMTTLPLTRWSLHTISEC